MNTITPVSPRLEKIGQAIMHELSQLLIRDVEDKALKLVQLTKVIVTKDLKQAKVYFVLADPAKDLTAALKSFKKAAPWFRCELAKRMELRVTPELKFFYDESREKVQQILALLNKI